MKTVLLIVNFVVIAAVGLSEERQEYYVITSRCNVTHDDVISATRGTVQCGAICLGHTDCLGFHYSSSRLVGGGCHIYGNTSIAESDNCIGEELDITDIYIEQELADARNMSWISNKNNSSNGANNTGNNGTGTSCQNGGSFDILQDKCICIDGWYGENCENISGDCSALHLTGTYTEPGIYYIHPSTSPAPFKVFCFITPGFGLTQIQAHLSASHTFNRSWSDYKQGFSYNNDMRDSWLGNDYIHYISTSRDHHLHLEIKNGSEEYRSSYFNFVMASEEENYTVTYDMFSATTPNTPPIPCWPPTSSLPFSTYDRDNDGDPDVNCAALHGAGWWFESVNCTQCNLNGEIDPIKNSREGKPSEAFVLPIDDNFSPEYILMALYWMP